MIPFQRSLHTSDTETIIKLSGFINEISQFGSFIFSNVPKLSIDFTDVTLINSVGVLHWLEWIKCTQNRNSKIPISYIGCPKVIVDQMINIKGFLPKGAVVQSFVAPYRCDSCKTNLPVMLNLGVDYLKGADGTPGKITAPKPLCPKCSQVLTADFIPERYFRFLQPLLSVSGK